MLVVVWGVVIVVVVVSFRRGSNGRNFIFKFLFELRILMGWCCVFKKGSRREDYGGILYLLVRYIVD